MVDEGALWQRLSKLAARGCPMGCGTAMETLEEAGLVGQHASRSALAT